MTDSVVTSLSPTMTRLLQLNPRPRAGVLNWRIGCLILDPRRQSVEVSLVYVHIIISANEHVAH